MIGLLLWTFFASAASFETSFPFQQTVCRLGNQKVEVLLRFDKKIRAENDFSGAPLLFLKGKTTHAVEAVVGEKSGDFSFVKPREGSLCDKTQALKLRDGAIAILYSKDDRTFQELYQVVAYDLKRDQVLDKKEL